MCVWLVVIATACHYLYIIQCHSSTNDTCIWRLDGWSRTGKASLDLLHSVCSLTLGLRPLCWVLNVCSGPSSVSGGDRPGVPGEEQLAGGLLHRAAPEERSRGPRPGRSSCAGQGRRGGGGRLWPRHSGPEGEHNLKRFKRTTLNKVHNMWISWCWGMFVWHFKMMSYIF